MRMPNVIWGAVAFVMVGVASAIIYRSGESGHAEPVAAADGAACSLFGIRCHCAPGIR